MRKLQANTAAVCNNFQVLHENLLLVFLLTDNH